MVNRSLTANRSPFPVNRDLYIAKGTQATYTDHGMSWDNTGKNGHYASFEWNWP